MSFRKASVAAVLALSMTSAPVLAQASQLSAASSQASRAGATMEDESQLGGGFIIPLLALAAVIAGILVIVDGDEEGPVSP